MTPGQLGSGLGTGNDENLVPALENGHGQRLKRAAFAQLFFSACIFDGFSYGLSYDTEKKKKKNARWLLTLLTRHKAPRAHGIWLRLPATPVVPIESLSTAALGLVKLREQVKPDQTNFKFKTKQNRTIILSGGARTTTPLMLNRVTLTPSHKYFKFKSGAETETLLPAPQEEGAHVLSPII